MTSFTLNLISVKVSFNDIFKKTLNITPVGIYVSAKSQGIELKLFYCRVSALAMDTGTISESEVALSM